VAIPSGYGAEINTHHYCIFPSFLSAFGTEGKYYSPGHNMP